MSSLHASRDARAAAAILLAALCAGCARPLAVQHEFFWPTNGSADRIGTHTRHTVNHHRALQAAQHACGSQSSVSVALDGANLHDGPNPGLAAAHQALANLCATRAMPTAAAYGGASNAYRRWVEDQVRELPEASDTAASAAGGS